MKSKDLKDQEMLVELLEEQAKRHKYNQLALYEPYPWQKQFHRDGKTNPQRLLMTGNRCGKTESGCYEDAMHLTGRYPDWWEGKRYNRPVRMVVACNNTSVTRDVLQARLLGEESIGNPEEEGTGTIPRECLDGHLNFPGVPGAYQIIYIKHESGLGISSVYFKAYEQGQKALMGKGYDIVHIDEESPDDFYRQAVVRTLDSAGCVYLTFTPENGLTRLVSEFLNDLKPGQSITQAGWEDCPHLDEEAIRQMEEVFSPSELAMRKSGMPMLGQGLIYVVAESEVIYDPLEKKIQKDWPRLAAMDLGWADPTTWVSGAYDPKGDVIYLYDSYGQTRESPIYHSDAISNKEYGEEIPIMFPHDGNVHDKNSGDTWAEIYRQHGLNILYDTFTNKPPPGKDKGGLSIETGVTECLQRFQTGRLKINKNLYELLRELREYHRKDGKPAPKQNDHYLDAMRYMVNSIERFGELIDPSKQRGYNAYKGREIPVETRHYI